VDTAAETLQAKELGDITWLEHGLREQSQGMCRDVLRWLLALPGLRVPGQEARPGERTVERQQRRVHTLFGEIPLVRTYYHCPFQQAEVSFQAYTGLKVDRRQFPRLAGYLGPLAERFLRAGPPSGEKTPPRVYVATDGTGAPLRHEELKGRKGRQPDGTAQTHEIKVGAIFTQHPVAGEPPWRDLESTTYVSTTQRAGPFGEMMRTEFLRRFAAPPLEVIYLGDGAAWNWELQRVFFPSAIGIVDFYHAAEHVAQLVDLVEDRHGPSGRKRRRRWVKLLLRGKIDVLLNQVRAAFPVARREAGEKALTYFEKNRDRMRYGEFRKLGYFIGSGVVEAACKTLVAQRLKASGMHWSECGLSHILALRTAILSRRYDQFWRSLNSRPLAA
jgi:hypothetical protein